MKGERSLKECFQLIGRSQNSKEKFFKLTWKLLTLKTARDWLKLVPFPKSTGGDFHVHLSVMVECILLVYPYGALLT